MRLVSFSSLLIVACLLLLHTLAHGGPDHDAAITLVEQGKTLTPTGDLDRAMDVFRSVERTYPDEYTAIGYARWWIGNCLLAGGRNPEVREAMEPVVQWVKDGRIAGPQERLLFLHQYARVLPRGDELAKVAGDAVLAYGELSEPTVQEKEKTGFLYLFLSRCFFDRGDYSGARWAGEFAWSIGNELLSAVDAATAKSLDVKPGLLAGWGRVEQARATLKLGDAVLANHMLSQCEADYGELADDALLRELHTVQSECQVAVGQSGTVRAAVLDQLAAGVEGWEQDLWLRSAWTFADDAGARDATVEAIAPLALGLVCYPEAEIADWARREWNTRFRDSMPPEAFIDLLVSASAEIHPLAAAAVRVELAERLAEEQRWSEGLAVLREAETLSRHPRLGLGLAVARAHCQSPGDAAAEVRACESILPNASDNPARVACVAARVRPYYWQGNSGTTYGSWLNAHRAILPDRFYRLHAAWWLRDVAQDYPGALALLAPRVEADDLDAHTAKVVCLFRAEQDAEAETALAALERATTDIEKREAALYVAADSMVWHRAQVAEMLCDRILSTGASPIWTRDAICLKGHALKSLGRPAEARLLWEDLASQQPVDGLACEAKLDLAYLYRTEFDSPAAALAQYEDVLAADGEARAFHASASAGRARLAITQDNWEQARQVCEDGLATAAPSDVAGKGTLRALRAQALVHLGDPEWARAELFDLANWHGEETVRRLARTILDQEGLR